MEAKVLIILRSVRYLLLEMIVVVREYMHRRRCLLNSKRSIVVHLIERSILNAVVPVTCHCFDLA